MPSTVQSSSKSKKGHTIESIRLGVLSPSTFGPQTGEDAFPTVRDDSDNEMFWRPFWLRGAIIGTFCILFAVCTVAISCIASYSKRHDGLNDAQKGLKYLWRFGPTACKENLL